MEAQGWESRRAIEKLNAFTVSIDEFMIYAVFFGTYVVFRCILYIFICVFVCSDLGLGLGG